MNQPQPEPSLNPTATAEPSQEPNVEFIDVELSKAMPMALFLPFILKEICDLVVRTLRDFCDRAKITDEQKKEVMVIAHPKCWILLHGTDVICTILRPAYRSTGDNEGVAMVAFERPRFTVSAGPNLN